MKFKKRTNWRGGATQIVLDPAHLKKEHMGKRQLTNWGYTDDKFSEKTDLVGVPTLTNNWAGS